MRGLWVEEKRRDQTEEMLELHICAVLQRRVPEATLERTQASVPGGGSSTGGGSSSTEQAVGLGH